jgi:RNA polymerase sigma-70 factor (ECF subfamily)
LLFKSTFKDLCDYAIQYLKDYDSARNIVQEVFVAVWQKKENIDLSKPVRSYLYSAVRNKCLNYLRDHRKFSDFLVETEDLYIQKSYKPADRLIENELKQKINDSIEELPERCREVFLLSRYENLKYAEIADRLQISVKTVETQMSKALHHLRSRLKEFLMILIIILTGFLYQ